MHILVTNDDGPPSAQASPYILTFVRALEAAGHTVSVILPDTQRSWISKAHIVGQDVRATEYRPPGGSTTPWILVNSTPATCAQLGLSHFFQQRGRPDLVISGPNYGRNTTAVFALSSGTLGAALEAAVCGYRSVALSFAFFTRENEEGVVGEAAGHAVRVCEALMAAGSGWEEGSSRLYSVNVPLLRGVSGRRVVWTRMLQNVWGKGACFEEVRGKGDVGAAEGEEVRIREGGGGGGEGEDEGGGGAVRHFKWAPRFTDVYDSVEEAGPGSDGWTVKAGETSVTAIRANFMHVEGMEGEVKL